MFGSIAAGVGAAEESAQNSRRATHSSRRATTELSDVQDVMEQHSRAASNHNFEFTSVEDGDVNHGRLRFIPESPLREVVISSDTLNSNAKSKATQYMPQSDRMEYSKPAIIERVVNGSQPLGNIESVDKLTFLESLIKELLQDTKKMRPWRAYLSFLHKSGVLAPFKLIDMPVVESVYASLSSEEKMLNTFFITALLISILLLCIETDAHIHAKGFSLIFFLELFCMVIFVIEIVLQYSCLHTYLPSRIVSRGTPWFLKRKHRFLVVIWVAFGNAESAEKVSSTHCPAIIETRDNDHGSNANLRHKDESDAVAALDSEASRWGWLVLDLIATAPFFIEVSIAAAKASIGSVGDFESTFLDEMYAWNGTWDGWRLFRLIRVLRLFKMGEKSDRVRIIWRAIRTSSDGIWLLFSIVPLFVLLFSFFLFYAEMAGGYIEGDVWYYSDGTRSPFQSVADCFWLLIVTMTTVGYGDVVPITLQGKLVMSSVMILSLFIIAFPLCMITMQYSQCARDFADEKATHAKTAKRLRARFQRARLERLQSLIVEGAETGRRKKPPISMMRSKSAGNLMVGIK